jgi:hypothetical protein
MKPSYKDIAQRFSIVDAIRLTGCVPQDDRGCAVSNPQPGRSYRSPLRPDSNPSWTIYADKIDGHQRYHDHATKDRGNSINFVASAKSITRAEAYQLICAHLGIELKRASNSKSLLQRSLKPVELAGNSIKDVSGCVGVVGNEGVVAADKFGIFGTGTMLRIGPNGPYPESNCWWLYDETTQSASVRRRNGTPFGSKKSVSPNGSNKLPIGLSYLFDEAIYDESWEVIIAEGEKDTLAVLHGATHERAIPICMPSAGVNFSEELAVKLSDTVCSIYAQADRAGIEAAQRWYQQLKGHAFEVRVLIPHEVGSDWADFARGLSANEVVKRLGSKQHHQVLYGEAIMDLVPADYNERIKEVVEVRQGGSPLDAAYMNRCWEVLCSLPEGKRGTVAEVCRALGVATRGPEYAKVNRALKNAKKYLSGHGLVTTAPV